MSSNTLTDWLTAVAATVQAGAAVLASIAIFVGVIKWGWVLQWRNAIESVGAVAVNEGKMGYFTVPWWNMRNIFSRKMIQPPLLPTLSTLIKSGELFSFTSSMMDCAPLVNEEVSWRPLYEAFFQELAWIRPKPHVKYPDSIQRALDMAYKTVHATEKSHSREKPSKYMDRHLFYSNASRMFPRKYLRKCVLDLPPIKGLACPAPSDLLLGCKGSWEEDLRKAWIWKGKPSIQVSREELICLGFMLGMPLEVKKDREGDSVSLSGKGIHGTYIYGECGSPTDPWKLSLVHWRRDSPDQEPSKGSGFASSFAIYMACGCLPFGQSLGLTHVVQITEETYKKGIQNGGHIGDDLPDDEDLSEGEQLASYECLRVLPTATFTNYYGYCEKESQTLSHIYNIESQVVSEWPEVVARIAFGGLVPMAALNLVQAVRFTAQGYKKFSEEEMSLVFNMLMDLIFKAQQRTKEIQLFGQYIEDLASIQKNMKIDYQSHQKKSTRSAAAIFSRLMTVLEYLTESSVNNTGKPKQIAVFNACRDELSQSYQDAVEEHRAEIRSPESDVLVLKPRMKSASEQIIEIQNSKVITTKICGQIARYIILTWTYYVGIVVWDSVEETECRTKFLPNADQSRIYSPYNIASERTPSTDNSSIGSPTNSIPSNGSSIKDLPESFVLS